MNEDRTNFGSKLGVILATAGSAVGLGNVWRFPYMTGQNGGAAFILIYIGCVLLLGIPCMVSEFVIGRHGASNTARAYSKLSGGKPWKYVGYMAHWIPHHRLLRRGVGVVPPVHSGVAHGQPQR